MLTFVENNQELYIRFQGKLIIYHSQKKPAFFMGEGFSSYEMYHGNFDIRSELESKIPLINFEIIKAEQKKALIRFYYESLQIQINFHIDDDDLLKMSVETNEKCHNRFWFRLISTSDEAIYGCGEQFSR